MSEHMMQVANPFDDGAGEIVSHQPSALVAQESERAIAEVRSAMQIAKMFPRDMRKSMDNILNSCARQGLAEHALYSYARGGTEITGPSIRLAEAMAQSWGHLQFGIRELDQRNGASTVEAFCWDVETNTRKAVVFQVEHARHTKSGKNVLKDPRDIYELVANQGARRLRACILAVIPGDVTEAAMRQCEQTLNTKETPTPERVKQMLDAFAAYGVTTEHVEKRIQRRIDAITAPQMVQLRKIYTSIRDGMSAPGAWFDALEVKTPKQSQAATLKAVMAGNAPASSQTPENVADAQIVDEAAERPSEVTQKPSAAVLAGKKPAICATCGAMYSWPETGNERCKEHQ